LICIAKLSIVATNEGNQIAIFVSRQIVKFSSRNAVHIVAGKVFDRDQDKNERKIAPMAIKQLRKISRTYTVGKIMIKSSYMSAAL
jgi:hypothetical protein